MCAKMVTIEVASKRRFNLHRFDAKMPAQLEGYGDDPFPPRGDAGVGFTGLLLLCSCKLASQPFSSAHISD
jgi:hypothetical protein